MLNIMGTQGLEVQAGEGSAPSPFIPPNLLNFSPSGGSTSGASVSFWSQLQVGMLLKCPKQLTDWTPRDLLQWVGRVSANQAALASFGSMAGILVSEDKGRTRGAGGRCVLAATALTLARNVPTCRTYNSGSWENVRE